MVLTMAKSETRLWKTLFLNAYNIDDEGQLPNCKFFKIALKEAQQFCEIHLKRKIGNGERTKFWHHDWGYGCLSQKLPDLYALVLNQQEMVSQILHSQSIALHFQPLDSRASLDQFIQLFTIIGGQATLNQNQDEVEWDLTKSKEFTVNSAYKELKNESQMQTLIHRVLKMKVPPRMKVFLWLAYYKKILTAENLQKRGWNLSSMCVMYRSSEETIKHMFSNCQFAMDLYRKVASISGIQQRDWNEKFTIEEATNWTVSSKGNMTSRELILLSIFICWRERCTRIFREKEKEVDELTEEVLYQWRILNDNA